MDENKLGLSGFKRDLEALVAQRERVGRIKDEEETGGTTVLRTCSGGSPVSSDSTTSSERQGSSNGRAFAKIVVSPHLQKVMHTADSENTSPSGPGTHSVPGKGRLRRSRGIRAMELPASATPLPLASTTVSQPSLKINLPKTAARSSSSPNVLRKKTSASSGSRGHSSSNGRRRFSLSSSSSAKEKSLESILKTEMKGRRKLKSQDAANTYDSEVAAADDISLAVAYAMQPIAAWKKWDFDQERFLEAFVAYHLKEGDLIPVLQQILESDLAARLPDKVNALLREGTTFTCRFITVVSKRFECHGDGGSRVENAAKQLLSLIDDVGIADLENCIVIPRYIQEGLANNMWALDGPLSAMESDDKSTTIALKNAAGFSTSIGPLIANLFDDAAESSLQMTGQHKALLGIIRTSILHAYNRSRGHDVEMAEQHSVALEQVSSALFLKRFNPYLTMCSSQALRAIKDRHSEEYKKAWHVHVVVLQVTKLIQKLANHQRFEVSDGPLQYLNIVLEKYEDLFNRFLKISAPVTYGSIG